MRGTPWQNLKAPPARGIIPAYAGNTVQVAFQQPKGRDHPRVCGEHKYGGPLPVLRQGSSPRMRGTPGTPTRQIAGRRIIPAYAGNTQIPPKRTQRGWDHPRVCGEHLHGLQDSHRGRGSSPRMRGTPVQEGGRVVAAGIIPAYAGNTSWHRSCSTATRDHPRVCGEHITATEDDHIIPGSSPRMRGTPFGNE